MFRLLITFLFSINAFAALNDVDRSEILSKTLLKNGGFESGKTLWTASGGTFAVATSGSNLLTGKVSGTWDSGSASQTLTSTAVSIPNGLKGKSGVAFCSILTPSGTATHTIQAYDGSNILSSTTVVSNTSPVVSAASFLFPSSGSVSLRLVSVASDEPSITIDDCYLGPSENVLGALVKPQDIFSAKISDTDVVSSESTDWINGNCTDATTGEATCTFNTGIFSVAPNCTCSASEGSGSSAGSCETSAASSTSVTAFTRNNAGSASDRTLVLQCQKAGVDALLPAFKVDQLANSWSGYHDTTCSWARTNTALGDPTADASCALVERTNQNFGTVSASGSVLPAITFTPKRAGRYYACANVQLNNSALASTSIRLTSGATVLGDTATSLQAGNIANMIVCGIHVANDTSAQTISLQTAVSSGTVTVAAAGVATGAIEWSVFAIDQSLPAPAIAQDVMSSSSGRVKLVSAYITNSGTPTVSRQDGNWISSLTDNGAGDTTINIAAGTFSTIPNCTCSVQHSVARFCTISDSTTPSTTALRVLTTSVTPTASDEEFHIICVGAP